jgi:hypothetical protein
VNEIREVAKEALNKNSAFDFGEFDLVEESFSHMRDHKFLSINHTPEIATHYNKVIVIINPTETESMAAIFFLFLDVTIQQV